VHHALRAFTPKGQKEVKGAAQTLRANPGFDTATVLTELRIGEALVSMLDDHGSPTTVDRSSFSPRRAGLLPFQGLNEGRSCEIIPSMSGIKVRLTGNLLMNNCGQRQTRRLSHSLRLQPGKTAFRHPGSYRAISLVLQPKVQHTPLEVRSDARSSAEGLAQPAGTADDEQG
jgi:hypothetical protein